MKPRVSILIPSRNERFLPETVRDILEHATGDIEVIVTLDGYWPDVPLVEDPRVIYLHRGSPLSMRHGINSMAQLARGKFLLKCDGHVSFSPGFDEVLAADCDADWVVIPRRDRLDPIKWCKTEDGRPPIDHHFLDFPFAKTDDPNHGLHGRIWPERTRARMHIPIDDEMTTQGSCWFMHRDYFMRRMYPLDIPNYDNISHEAQEITLKCWLSGGRVVVNKQAQYLHLHKGNTYGRMYHWDKDGHYRSTAYCTDYWMHNRWTEAIHTIDWLVEKFWPVPSWPEDWHERLAQYRAVAA